MAFTEEEGLGGAGQESAVTRSRPAYASITNDPYRYQESLRYRGQESGLEGPMLEQFMQIGKRLRGLRRRDIRSDAALQALERQRQLASAQKGVAAAQTGPFAGAGIQQAERQIGKQGAQAAALAAQADKQLSGQLSRQSDQLIKEGKLRQFEEQKAEEAAREARKGILGGGIGGAIGAGLGALAFLTPAAPIAPALMAAGGQLGSALGQETSDENMKSNVKDGNKRAREMLDALSAKEYDIDGARDYGVMAQDMPQDMVKEFGGVKTIPEGFGKLLAGMANLNERLKKLEG